MNPITLDLFWDSVEEESLYSSKENLEFYLAYLFEGIQLDGARILDVGGGMGLFSFYAACMGATEAVVLEPEGDGSTARADRVFARLRDKLNLQGRVSLIAKPLMDYAPGGGGWDIVLLHNSVNHLDESACIHLQEDPAARKTYSAIFNHLASLTKSSGMLIVADCSRYNLYPMLGLKNPFTPQIEWHKHQSPRRWARHLREAGFANERIAWTSFNRFRRPGRLLLGNALGAFLGRSHFRLTMQRT